MNRQELKQILSSRFDFEKWKELLGLMFPKVDFLSKPIELDANLVKNGGQVGTIRLNDGRALGLFKFEVADNIIIARNRKGLRDIAIRYVDQDIIHGAIVLYYSNNQEDYRLTFVSKQTSLNADGTLVTSTTAPKRFTFLLGGNEPCTTATNRLIELVDKTRKGSLFLVDVEDAFSVERLNKDFFNGYKERYNKFLTYLNEDSKEDRDYVKKLLGRLVFLHFLQKKGWMGVPATNPDWGGGDKNYLYNLVKRYNGSSRLLSDVLEYLFFETLNKERTDDAANSCLGDNIKIPYLNGGLFDRDDIDNKDVDFPYSYFLDLMEFFAMYNFTIDENDPDDAEIGVDPEMLGHIFENLLEDNKDKGAFYTPKEIVQYMSQESIAQYLKTYTDESLHSAVDELVKKRRVDDALQDKETALKVHQLLCNVKVCDPAIGSGAFPMGVLNVLYHSRLLLYGFTNPTQPFSPAAVKREIIQNNIYGVDIEKGAIDIARLRFWLSIVVDSEKPEPLPNFDYKFMQGDSLRESFGGFDLSRISSRLRGGQSKSMQLVIGLDSNLSKQNLLRLLREYFSVTNHTQKNSMRSAINEEVKTLLRNSFGGTTSSLEKLAQIDCSSNQDFFLWHTWFKDVFDKGGFDVVIANPPYLKEGRISKSLFEKYKDSPYYMGKMDLWYMFACKSLDLLNDKGVLCYIATNNWVTSFGARILRNKVMKETRICAIIDFGALMVFESASIQTMVMLFQKDKETNNYQFDYRKLNKMDISEDDAVRILRNEKSLNAECYSPHINRSVFTDKTFTFSKNDAVFDKMQELSRVIYLENSELTNGIHPHFDFVNKKQSLIYGIPQGTGIFGLSDGELEHLNLSEEELGFIKPYYNSSEQVHRYYLSPTDLYIIYTPSRYKDPDSMNDYPRIKEHLDKFSHIITSDNRPYGLHRAREEKFFNGEKIIALRKCVGKPIFSYSEGASYMSALFYIIQTNRVNMKYLVGLFNSKIIEFWLKNKGKMQGANYQLDKEPLQQIPIAVPSKEAQQLIANIVDYIICIKSESRPISKLVSNLFISEYFEKIIDGCVFEIYFPQQVVDNGLNIIEYAERFILPVANLKMEEEKISRIWNVFSTIKKTDNEIRNRLELFALRSPGILKPIIES